LLVLEGYRCHAQAQTADRLDLAAPEGVQHQVARDAEQPPDGRPAPRVVLGPFLERPRESLRDQVEDHLELTDAA
jgi:hypothetical protein